MRGYNQPVSQKTHSGLLYDFGTIAFIYFYTLISDQGKGGNKTPVNSPKPTNSSGLPPPQTAVIMISSPSKIQDLSKPDFSPKGRGLVPFQVDSSKQPPESASYIRRFHYTCVIQLV